MKEYEIGIGRNSSALPNNDYSTGNIGQMKASVLTLGISLTESCPVGCSHCIVSSLPAGRDQNLRELGAWIQKAGTTIPIRSLGFTGGEPFYRFVLLEEGVRMADALCLTSGVMTSAYWAVDDRRTESSLLRLRKVGLTGIGVSVDEQHAVRVPLDRPRRAIRIAANLGLSVTLSARFPANLESEDVRDYLKAMVGPELDVVTDVVLGEIQPLGRANKDPAPLNYSHRRRRLCPASMLMVTVDGFIKCCCSIDLEPNSPLVLGRIDETPLMNAYSRWRNSALMLGLVAGGVDMLWEWCEEAGLVLPMANHFSSHDVCGACTELLSDPVRVEHIVAKVTKPSMLKSLALRHFLVTGDSWALFHANRLS